MRRKGVYEACAGGGVGGGTLMQVLKQEVETEGVSEEHERSRNEGNPFCLLLACLCGGPPAGV